MTWLAFEILSLAIMVPLFLLVLIYILTEFR